MGPKTDNAIATREQKAIHTAMSVPPVSYSAISAGAASTRPRISLATIIPLPANLQNETMRTFLLSKSLAVYKGMDISLCVLRRRPRSPAICVRGRYWDGRADQHTTVPSTARKDLTEPICQTPVGFSSRWVRFTEPTDKCTSNRYHNACKYHHFGSIETQKKWHGIAL